MNENRHDFASRANLEKASAVRLRRLAYNVYELAVLCGRHPSRIQRAIAAGALRAHKDGSETLITHDDAAGWLENLPLRAVKGGRHG
jgi:hypothetical protein